jgi:hypothetical protein
MPHSRKARFKKDEPRVAVYAATLHFGRSVEQGTRRADLR